MALAEKCETSTSYIGEIEIGKKFPSVEMLEKIAGALSVPPYKLFMKENDENSESFSQKSRETLIKDLQQSVAIIVNTFESY